MESTDCSREYLLSIREEAQRKEIQKIISIVKNSCIARAKLGNTSCKFKLDSLYALNPLDLMSLPPISPTDMPDSTVTISASELNCQLHEAFPRCQVHVNQTEKEGSGIRRTTINVVIDWS